MNLNLPPGQYGLIYADPPWSFRTYTDAETTKAPRSHYPVMDLDAIKALPVAALAAPNSALVMWAVAPMLDQALDVIKTWGFKFKSGGSWAKQSSTGAKWHMGTGYWFRSASEFYLFATRGNPKVVARDVRNLVVAPVREHSRKPDQLRQDLERMFPAVPRLELFARQIVPGWTVWGNDLLRFDGQPLGRDAAGPSWARLEETEGLAAAVMRNTSARTWLSTVLKMGDL